MWSSMVHGAYGCYYTVVEMFTSACRLPVERIGVLKHGVTIIVNVSIEASV